MTEGIAFYPAHNALNKRDVTGAFRPEALAWCRIHGCKPVEIDNTKSVMQMRRQVLSELRQHEKLPLVAFFCHGYRRRIQLGFNMQTIAALANEFARLETEHVGLYCCSTASEALDGRGFAHDLAAATHKASTHFRWLDASRTAGHTSWNPYRIRIPSGGEADYIVAPRSEAWPLWVKTLRENQDFRLRVLTIAEEDMAGS